MLAHDNLIDIIKKYFDMLSSSTSFDGNNFNSYGLNGDSSHDAIKKYGIV